MYDLLTESRHLVAAADISGITEGVDSGDRVFLILAAIGAFVLVAVFVLSLIDKIHRRNAEMALKRDMLERGMPVDEIERVISAQPAKGSKLAETLPYTKQ